MLFELLPTRNFLVPNKVRKAYVSSEPLYVKQLPQEIQVLCTYIHSPVTHGAPRRLVCFRQPEGRVFSHPNLPSAHQMFEVCFLGHDLQIPRTPLWSLDKSVRMFIKYWGGCGSFQGMGHPPGHLPWRLAGAVGKRVSQHQCQEEHFYACLWTHSVTCVVYNLREWILSVLLWHSSSCWRAWHSVCVSGCSGHVGFIGNPVAQHLLVSS